MKRTFLFLAVFLAFTLSACGGPQTSPSSAPAPSAALPGEGEPSAQSMDAAYAEALSGYSAALEEQWDGDVLTRKGMEPLLADCYGDAPLENIGYAITDLDGDGIEELAIGTTQRVADEFYGKLILALYTRDGDAAAPVFQSGARNRWYYAGGNKFAHLGSGGADDSFATTEEFADGALTDVGISTAPGDYAQMELTPMSQWTGMSDMPETK